MAKNNPLKIIFLFLGFTLFVQSVNAQFAVRPVKGNDDGIPDFTGCFTDDGEIFIIEDIKIAIDDSYPSSYIESLGVVHLETKAYELVYSGLGIESMTQILVSDNDEEKGPSIISGPFLIPENLTDGIQAEIAGFLHPSTPISDINNIIFIVNVVENFVPEDVIFDNQCKSDLPGDDKEELPEGKPRARQIAEIFTLYPNPVSPRAIVTINQKRSEVDTQYKLYNIMGRCIKDFTLENGKSQMLLNLSNLNSGLYFLRADNQSKTQKIIIP